MFSSLMRESNVIILRGAKNHQVTHIRVPLLINKGSAEKYKNKSRNYCSHLCLNGMGIYLFLLLRSVTTPPHSTLEMHILRLTLLFAIYHSLALSQWWVILVGRIVANHRHYCSQVQFNCEKTPINQIFNNHALHVQGELHAQSYCIWGPWNTRSSTNLRTKVRWTHQMLIFYFLSTNARV